MNHDFWAAVFAIVLGRRWLRRRSYQRTYQSLAFHRACQRAMARYDEETDDVSR